MLRLPSMRRLFSIGQKRSSCREQRVRARPHLEMLEDRCLLSAGALDLDFGMNGYTTTPEISGGLNRMVINPSDGSIIAVQNGAIARYLVNEEGSGVLDTDGFGDQGIVYQYDPNAVYNAVTLDSAGRIVVVGSIVQEYPLPNPDFATYHTDFAVWRFLPDGRPDESFDGDGMVTTSFDHSVSGLVPVAGDGSPLVVRTQTGKGQDDARDVAIDKDGRIVVVGYSQQREYYPNRFAFGGATKIAVACYDPSDGSLATTNFGGGTGMVTTHFVSELTQGNVSQAYTVAIDSDNRIVVGGEAHDFSVSYLALARYKADGDLDMTNFGDGDGKVLTDTANGPNAAQRLAIDSQGRIVVGGGSGSEWNNFGLACYDSAGELDTSFGGGDGMVVTDFVSDDAFASLAIDRHDRIVVAGYTGYPDPDYPTRDIDIMLARYDSDGGLDNDFGNDGLVIQDLGTLDDGAADVVIDAYGRILVCGWKLHEPDSFGLWDSYVARFLGDPANIVTFPSAGDPDEYVTLEAPEGASLTDVFALAEAPGDVPENVEFPVGVLTFEVHNVTEGGATTVVISLPNDVTVDSYWKYGHEPGNTGDPDWYLFDYDGTTGAEIDNVNHLITLHFVDGQRGDDDLTANGVIVDPGAPAIRHPIEVQIDIRPDAVNLANQGVLPVVLFGSTDFDVTLVNLSTLRFAGAAVYQWSYADVNGDGLLDLELKFRTQDTTLRSIYEQLLIDDMDLNGVLDSNQQEAQVSLTGETLSEELFEGSDELRLFLAGRALRDLLTSLAAAGAI